MNIKGFAIQKGYKGKEELALCSYCSINKLKFIQLKSNEELPTDYIPCGSVEWTLKLLGKNIIPDYYPNFLSEYLHRKIWKTDKWPLGEKVFIKPADKYKRFNGFITNKGYKGKKRPPYWCSDVVKFENEWRYYVSNGNVLTAEWYNGDEINTPDAPIIDFIKIPNNFCAAIDFGMVNDKLTLVEVNHPFACGWYGKDHDKYAEWLYYGWEFVKNEK